MAVGLDTHILIRFLVHDNPEQAAQASALLQDIATREDSCFINIIVLCEMIWVLESAYNFGRPEIACILERILATKQLEIDLKDLVRQAVRDYREMTGDLADYLIGHVNQARGCSSTVSFDQALKDSRTFQVLDPAGR